MDWKNRFFELLKVVNRFLKHQATIGELRATARRLEEEIKPGNKS